MSGPGNEAAATRHAPVVRRPADHPGHRGRFANVTRMVFHPTPERPNTPNAGLVTYEPGAGFPLRRHDFAQVWYVAEEQCRFGPLVPDEDACDGSEDVYNFGERQYVGRLTTPEFQDWLARQERREAADMAAGAGGVGWASPCDGPSPGFAATGKGDQQLDGFILERATGYVPHACRT